MSLGSGGIQQFVKSGAKRRPHVWIVDLIERANSIPHGAVPPDPYRIDTERGEEGVTDQERTAWLLNECKAFPGLLEKLHSFDDPSAFLAGYLGLCEVRRVMSEIVDLAESARAAKSKGETWKKYLVINNPVCLEVSSELGDHQMEFSGGPLPLVLEGCGLLSFGRCPICTKIYWLKREDSPACSSRCVNAINGRRTRLRKKKAELAAQKRALGKMDCMNPSSGVVVRQKDRVAKIEAEIAGMLGNKL